MYWPAPHHSIRARPNLEKNERSVSSALLIHTVQTEIAVQLSDGDRFRIDHFVLNLNFIGQTSLIHQRQRLCQHLQHHALAGERLSDEHETVSNEHHFVRLGHFRHERLGGLQILLMADLDHVRIDQIVVGLRESDAGKQIADDSVEEWDVMS